MAFLGSILPMCSETSEPQNRSYQSSDEGVEPKKGFDKSDRAKDGYEEINEVKRSGNKIIEKEKGAETVFLGKKYYEENIYPKLKENCESCHVGPRIEVAERGPMTIYNYEKIEKWLKDSDTFLDTTLMKKLTGAEPHGGGALCGSMKVAYCLNFKELFEGLTGLSGDTLGAASYGEVHSSHYKGNIYGFAVDKENKEAFLEVTFYADKEGELLGSVLADDSGSDGGNGGNHAFNFLIPEEKMTHGQEMEVYAYVKVGGEDIPLKGSPYSFTPYKPQAEAFFQESYFSGCQGCHAGYDYTAWYTALISPTPVGGGLANSNQLYLKASNANGDHPGGNRCGGTDLCDYLQNWWRMEFE